ncbi:hypothetical protein ACIOGT_10225 [Streptomyces microflavus]|uniref:hypothetical protein n=1 Tax=Streptomyces microflavus TaxID=1919 RepID=UPI0038232800
MDWIAPVSTIGGAIVGVGSALLAERLRWRREGNQQWAQQRRAVYQEFVMASSRAHSQMRASALKSGLSDSERFSQIHEAIDSSQLWQQRQALSLTAPSHIVALASEVTRALEAIRNLLIEAPSITGDRFLHLRAVYWLKNAELREAMRLDLGMSGPPDPEVGHYRGPDPLP